jgi:hypothetical protein
MRWRLRGRRRYDIEEAMTVNHHQEIQRRVFATVSDSECFLAT